MLSNINYSLTYFRKTPNWLCSIIEDIFDVLYFSIEILLFWIWILLIAYKHLTFIEHVSYIRVWTA